MLILLVEDNRFMQRAVEGIVKNLDITLLKADNGLEALACLRKQTVDLVLMDLQMPLMDGYATARHIRSTLRLTVPIVALTADVPAQEEYRQWGIDACMPKPVTRSQLLAWLSPDHPTAARPTSEGPASTCCRIERAVLTDLYDDDWSFIREQYQFFQETWPGECRRLSESLETGQLPLFNKQAHTFSSTLEAVGMSETALELKQLRARLDGMTPNERRTHWHKLIDEIEEALTELDQLCWQSGES